MASPPLKVKVPSVLLLKLRLKIIQIDIQQLNLTEHDHNIGLSMQLRANTFRWIYKFEHRFLRIENNSIKKANI